MRSIDLQGGQLTYVAQPEETMPASITVCATAPGLAPATLNIPLSSSMADLPVAVAMRSSARRFAN
jgi:hypothetical protein